jgi:hypothetical protein
MLTEASNFMPPSTKCRRWATLLHVLTPYGVVIFFKLRQRGPVQQLYIRSHASVQHGDRGEQKSREGLQIKEVTDSANRDQVSEISVSVWAWLQQGETQLVCGEPGGWKINCAPSFHRASATSGSDSNRRTSSGIKLI